MPNKRLFFLFLPVALSSIFSSTSTVAVTIEELAEQMQQLAVENLELRKNIERLEMLENAKKQTPESTKQTAGKGLVNVNSQYSYEMLDPTTKINRKQLLLLEKKKSGEIAVNSVYLGGAVTPILDYQKSNTESKFGYLMEHPTANNQRTKRVSEALVHSAQLNVTASMGDIVTAYLEILYDPEQSFGSGTNTSLERNQLQLRKGYVLFGNLDQSPFYTSIGKMATPFGLTDTPNPFTASTVWHAFGGLAYGLSLAGGYSEAGLNLTAMAVQGGSQFRASNTSVDGTNVPSKLNNYVFDANYLIDDTLIGASYLRGSTYCQDFPITHFSECSENNPAYDIYLQAHFGKWMLLAEFAKTLDEWPGTFNPSIPQYGASKVTSWDVGGRYAADLFGSRGYLSLDFSRFVAGPSGSPWEKQDQLVLGLSSFILGPSVKLFGEYIHTDGFAPLNFISGGNLGEGITISDSNVKSDIILFGVNVAF